MEDTEFLKGIIFLLIAVCFTFMYIIKLQDKEINTLKLIKELNKERNIKRMTEGR